MKKNILIILLTIWVLLASLYAFVQQGFATEQRRLAEKNAIIAQENAYAALSQKRQLEMQLTEAINAQMTALQKLEECQKSAK